MPATTRELLDSLHSTLTATMDHMDEIGVVEEKLASAKAQLSATLGELDTSRQRLREAQGKLAEVEKTLRSKEHLLHNEQAQSLADINRQIASATEELKGLQNEITNAKGEYNGIVAGMQSLSQRLRI